MTFEGKDKFNASVNSTCAQPPSPSSGLQRAICRPCQSRGCGICKFFTARGPGICQPRGHSLSNTRAVSHQNVTTQRFLLGKKAYWLICQGQEKVGEGCKACSRFYACFSSLLIKPKLLHSGIGAIANK